MRKIHDRLEYEANEGLDFDSLTGDPMLLFTSWFELAYARVDKDPNAMVLSTVDNGVPKSRVVLMKEHNENGFIFYTNYESEKGRNMESNPNVSLNFFWKELERQIRIQGVVEKVSEELSDEYFLSRPINSRLGAMSSPQSQVIESREWLEQEFNRQLKEIDEGQVKRPANWGGYIVKPSYFEFWQGRKSRLHDRVIYQKNDSGAWSKALLAP